MWLFLGSTTPGGWSEDVIYKAAKRNTEFARHWKPVTGSLIYKPFDRFRSQAQIPRAIRSEPMTMKFGSQDFNQVQCLEEAAVFFSSGPYSPFHIWTNGHSRYFYDMSCVTTMEEAWAEATRVHYAGWRASNHEPGTWNTIELHKISSGLVC